MNPFDYGKGMKTKLIAWKAKMDDLSGALAMRGSKENAMALGNNPELSVPFREMSSGIAQFNKERPAELASKTKNIDYGYTKMRGQYVLRPQFSWTGLYGKEPWPRVRKQWEKV
jgi:hypothetical protein